MVFRFLCGPDVVIVGHRFANKGATGSLILILKVFLIEFRPGAKWRLDLLKLERRRQEGKVTVAAK
jgi:hypothetical protein